MLLNEGNPIFIYSYYLSKNTLLKYAFMMALTNKRSIKYSNVMVTLLSIKFSSLNFAFIRVHSIGRAQVNLEDIIANNLLEFPSPKYKTLENYHTLWYVYIIKAASEN